MPRTKTYWLHALSPTHVGTGRGVGYIDVPIHREKVTNWPAIPGSAFKGVWRDWARQQNKSHIDLAFGRASDHETNASNAGSLIPTDARLVCLPIRSFSGTFAWCTSPLALQLLRRDWRMACVQCEDLPDAPGSLPEDTIHHAKQTVLKQDSRIYLEDLDFDAQQCDTAHAWAKRIGRLVFPDDPSWQAMFQKRFAVLPDAVFDFLTETGTEVTARVKIDDKSKTVVDGALWNEEALPAETILAGLVTCDRLYGKNADGMTEETLMNEFAGEPLTLQIGGKATVGRGRVRCVFGRSNGMEGSQ